MLMVEIGEFPLPSPGRTGWPWTSKFERAPGSYGTEELTWPTITVITPSFNQSRYLEETIRSVLLQGYPRLQYIIMDGGSTDGSVDLIQKYSPWLSAWVSEEDRGQSHAINKGFEIAIGDVIGWLNSDDVYAQGALHEVGRYFGSDADCDVLAGFGEFRNENGQKILWSVKDLPQSVDQLLEYPLGRYLPQPSVFFRRRLLNAVPKLDESLHYAMDLDLWLRMASQSRIQVVPELLSWMRVHDSAKTVKHNLLVYTEVDRIIENYRAQISDEKYFTIRKAIRQARARAYLRLAASGQNKLLNTISALKEDRAILIWGGLSLLSRLFRARQ
jgi:glycosyltransferase involved in cell wall biosynthesis